MEKIKACHIVSGLRSGGVESMIYNYCSHMSKDKFDFYLLYQHNAFEKNIKEFTNLNFKLKRIPSKKVNLLGNYLATYNFLKDNKIDVVHCHMTLMNFIPLLAAKKAGIKVKICHSHGSDVRSKSNLIEKIEDKLRKLCFENSDYHLACGQDAGKYLYESNDFKIIYNAIDLKKFIYNEQSRNKIRSALNVDDNCFLIGHIGRFETQKNHYFILDLMKKLNEDNIKYKVVFLGNGELYNEFVESIKKNQLDNNAIFCGVVANTNDYYSAFDMFILPSLYEGLPVSALEAQASGLLCLLSKNIDESVIVDSDRLKLLNLDVKEWQENIVKAIADNKYRNREINLEKFNDKHLNIENEYKELEKIYLTK